MKPGRLMKPSEGPHQRLGAPSEPRWPDLLPSTRRRRSSHLVRPDLGGRRGRGSPPINKRDFNWTWPADDASAAMVAKRNAPGEKAVKIRRSQFKKKHRSNFASLTSSDILHFLIFFFFFIHFTVMSDWFRGCCCVWPRLPFPHHPQPPLPLRRRSPPMSEGSLTPIFARLSARTSDSPPCLLYNRITPPPSHPPTPPPPREIQK